MPYSDEYILLAASQSKHEETTLLHRSNDYKQNYCTDRTIISPVNGWSLLAEAYGLSKQHPDRLSITHDNLTIEHIQPSKIEVSSRETQPCVSSLVCLVKWSIQIHLNRRHWWSKCSYIQHSLRFKPKYGRPTAGRRLIAQFLHISFYWVYIDHSAIIQDQWSVVFLCKLVFSQDVFHSTFHDTYNRKKTTVKHQNQYRSNNSQSLLNDVTFSKAFITQSIIQYTNIYSGMHTHI